MSPRLLHPDFDFRPQDKEQPIVDLFLDLRQCSLSMHPEVNELIYHTHALTAVFTVSEKLADGYCMLPIYSAHINLGLNKGALLSDPQGLLKGSEKHTRHIRASKPKDYRNQAVEEVLRAAYALALEDLDKPVIAKGITISKIKRNT